MPIIFYYFILVLTTNIGARGDKTVELIDMEGKCVKGLEDYPLDYHGETMFTFQDNIVVCGGRTPNDAVQKQCRTFNPKLGKWSSIPSLDIARLTYNILLFIF